MTLNWLGEDVIRRHRQAAKRAVNETLSAAAIHAKQNHDWDNRTGTLEGSIDITEYAHETATGVAGTWGSRDVVYARIHELGGVIEPKHGKALVFEIDGETKVVAQVTIPARPYLRPAADAEYPGLAGRLKRHVAATLGVA